MSYLANSVSLSLLNCLRTMESMLDLMYNCKKSVFVDWDRKAICLDTFIEYEELFEEHSGYSIDDLETFRVDLGTDLYDLMTKYLNKVIDDNKFYMVNEVFKEPAELQDFRSVINNIVGKELESFMKDPKIIEILNEEIEKKESKIALGRLN